MTQRVVVLGAAGFVGSHIARELEAGAYRVIGLSREDCDLTRDDCKAAIGAAVQDGDIVVCAAAKAPAKNLDMLAENVAIIGHIAEALKGRQLTYVLNVSSDAVYADSMDQLTESSLVAPLSAHGIMHCMREHILGSHLSAPLGHVRPTLIYGMDDPHNGYGPNSFIRLAKAGKPLELFGNGEERRDHVFVGDVARIAAAMIARKTEGAVNAVSGKVMSFMEIAQLVAKAHPATEIRSKPRSGPMPHNGYRAFSNERARALCPGLPFQEMEDYVIQCFQHAEAA